jgi:hypothetical protein
MGIASKPTKRIFKQKPNKLGCVKCGGLVVPHVRRWRSGGVDACCPDCGAMTRNKTTKSEALAQFANGELW